MHLPKDAPWLAEFMAEILAFPKARHDDQVDSLSQFLEWTEITVFEVDWGCQRDDCDFVIPKLERVGVDSCDPVF